MRSKLCEAVIRCHVRRLRTIVVAAPLPSSAALIALMLAPVALDHVGGAVGAELAGAVSGSGVSDALVLGPVMAAAAAGGALASSLPERSVFGQQIAGAPFSGTVAVTAVVLVPAVAGAFVLLPSLVAVCVALADELPGGVVAGVALSVATTAAIPAGAIVVEAGVAAFRGERRRPLAILAGLLAWAAAGLALGAAPLGPLAPVSGALRGSGSASVALVSAGCAALVLAVTWVSLAATRPGRVHGVKTARQLVRAGRLPIPTSLLVLLARRSDVRIAASGAVGFGGAGLALAAVAAARAPAPFLLGTTTALLASVFCPLIVCGLLLEGRWLWAGGPRKRREVVGPAGLAGLAGTACPVAAVGAGSMIASGTSSAALGVVGAYVVLGAAAALLAGAAIPWSGSGAGNQFASFAALAGIAIAASLVMGFVAPRLVDLGLPDAVVVTLACAAAAAAAFHVVGRRLGAGLR